MTPNIRVDETGITPDNLDYVLRQLSAICNSAEYVAKDNKLIKQIVLDLDEIIQFLEERK